MALNQNSSKVLVRCIARLQRLIIDFRDENFKSLLVCNHKAMSIDIWYVASSSEPQIMPLWQNMGPPRGSHV